MTQTTKTDREKYREVIFLAAKLWKALEITKARAEAAGVPFHGNGRAAQAIKAFHKWNGSGS